MAHVSSSAKISRSFLNHRLTSYGFAASVLLCAACGVDQRNVPLDRSTEEAPQSGPDVEPHPDLVGTVEEPDTVEPPKLEIELPSPTVIGEGEPLEPPDSQWAWEAEVQDLSGLLAPDARFVGVTLDEVRSGIESHAKMGLSLTNAL